MFRPRTQERIRRTILMEQVEDRTLFDAVAFMAAPPDVGPAIDRLECPDCELESKTVQHVHSTSVAEVVFVDEGVADHNDVIAELRLQGIEAHLISSHTDGLLQIADYLDALTEVRAVHIVAHGEKAQIQLGNALISADQFESQYASALETIGRALSEDGDILLYSCRIAAGAEGELFVDRFAELTGGDLAASNDVTGERVAGIPLSEPGISALSESSPTDADWLLEYTTGFVNSSEMVATTLAATVSGTLLREFATATDSSGDTEVFMRGTLIEVGLRDQGTFGSQTTPPPGWHPRNNNTTTRLGFVANPQMNDWASYDGDFFAPGTPVESFMIEINGENGASLINNTSGDREQIPGALGAPAFVNHCGDDAVQVDWSGTSHGVLDVERTYTLLENGLFILMQTTLTNTSATDLADVYFSHNVDPDNDVTLNAGYATTNTIVSQPSAANDIAHVSATQSANDGSYVSFAADDARARVAHGGFNNTDASNIWNGVSLNSAVGSTITADRAISIGFKFDSIAAGESVDFSYVYILAGGAAITDAFACLHAPSLDLDGDDSSAMTGDDHKAIYPVGTSGVRIADTDNDITDPDFSLISGATVTLTNPQSGDSLSVLTGDAGWPPGIAVAGSSTATNVILTGEATMAEYEAALGLVLFSSTEEKPDLTDRIIAVQVEDDDGLFSNVALTTVCLADIDVAKEQIGTPVRNAFNTDHWDVSFQLTVENTGSVTLSGIDLTEDLDVAASFGAAFVDAAAISAGDLTFAGAGIAPTVNASWNGSTIVNMLNDDGTLEAGDVFTLQFTATLDLRSVVGFPVESQAVVSADDPADASDENYLTDLSDSGSDPAGTNDTAPGANAGDPDDATPVVIRDLELSKQFSSAVASGNDGNFNVTYHLSVENTGTETLSNLSILDDLSSQLGGAFAGVISVNVNNVDATTAPAENSSYTGAPGSDLLDPSSASELRPGESFQVELTVELDPNSITAIYNAEGGLENSALASGDDLLGTIFDVSDDPTVTLNEDVEGDGEGDDPASIRLASLNVLRTTNVPVAVSSVAGSTANAGNWVVDYIVTVENVGNDTIENLSLLDDLSAQFGNAFVQVLGAPTILLTNNSGVGVVEPNNAVFDGMTIDEVFDTATSQLGVDDVATVMIRVEIDPDAGPAALVDGAYVGNAVAGGMSSDSIPINDISDDPGDDTDSDPNGDGNPDDPNAVRIVDVTVVQTIDSVAPALSGVAGHFDVTHTFDITNTGSESLSRFSLMDDFSSQFGGAFIGVTSLTSSNGSATNLPIANLAYDGTAGSDMLLGLSADEVRAGESFQVTLVIEVDPDEATATYNGLGELENHAIVAAEGSTGASVSSSSDDATNSANIDADSDGHPDDPTVLRIADMIVEKAFVASTPASSRVAGNFDVTFEITVTNTGNDPLSNLSLVADFQSQFGNAFVGIVPQSGAIATLVTSTASDPIEFNPGFDGRSELQLIENHLNTNRLNQGEFFVIRLVAEVDPDATGGILVGGGLQNQAVAQAMGTTVIIHETSDDPHDVSEIDANGDNDPEDPTLVYLPAIDLTKLLVAAPAKRSDGSWDVAFRLVLSNTGSGRLENLIWLDDLTSAASFGATWQSTPTVNLDTSNVVGGISPGFNTAWLSDPTVNILDDTGFLEPGDFLELDVTVNIEPDISGSTAGLIFNQAIGFGVDPFATTVSDMSDDPADLTDVDLNSDNNPDDATFIPIADIGIAKAVYSAVERVGATGEFDVEYVLVLENTGTVDLQRLQIEEALGAAAGHFGVGFVGVTAMPAIVASDLSTGALLPTLNANWNGTTNVDVFDGSSGLLKPGDSLVVRFTIGVDTVTGDSTSPTDFSNQAIATGEDAAGVLAMDLSDAGLNPNGTNGDTSEGDPTPLLVPQIRVVKDHGVILQNTDGTYVLPVTVTIANTGTVTVDSIQLNEDLASQFGNGFFGVQNASLQTPIGFRGTLPTFDPNWLGDTTSDVFTVDASALPPGDFFTFAFEAVVDPDAVDGVSQFMQNQVIVEARGTNYDGSEITVIDLSGNGALATASIDDDSVTPLIIPEVTTEKLILAQAPSSSLTPGNVDVTYLLTLTNSGTVTLVNPTLIDDWATQFGGAFVAVVDADLTNDVSAPIGSGVSGNPGYVGGATSMLTGAGQLLPGESVAVTVIVEVDPDSPTATLTNGQLLGQANGSATYDPTPGIVGGEITHANLSDDPTVATNIDPNSDGSPDDPTPLTVSSINVEKVVTSFGPAASSTSGNFDVTYAFTVVNTGTETLSNISLTDDLAAQFGGAFVRVASVAVANVSATNAPSANPLFDGTSATDMLTGSVSDEIRSGESFTVALVVEIDPDSVLSNYNAIGELENSATVAADGEHGHAAMDFSDDPTVGDDVDPNFDNSPDDPTSLRIGALNLVATADSPEPSRSGITGNFDVTFTFTVENTGNETLTDLAVRSDWATNLGGAFVGIVDADLSDDVSGAAAIMGSNAYSGLASENLFVAGSSLEVGESVMVFVTIEIDPDHATANRNSGFLLNHASASATSSAGATFDISDDPADLADLDINGDNNPDDPTRVSVPAVDITKTVTSATLATSGITGNYDVTYTFTVANKGTESLSNLSLVDDLASQFGGAFVRVASVTVANIDATNPPSANTLYDGTAASDLLAGAATDDLRSGESFLVTLVVEIDPDSVAATYNPGNELQNSATVYGDGENGGSATDDSDDPTVAGNVDPNSDNNPDDPTTLQIGALNVNAIESTLAPASSGIAGNFDVTYTFTIENTGNETLTDLTLTDDWETNFGGAFVGIVDADLSDHVFGAASVSGSSNYGGGATENLLVAGSSLEVGETASVSVVVEVDPDNATAALVSGSLLNFAVGSATAGTDNILDFSDDPTDPTNVDPNSDNNPDDPTALRIGSMEVTKFAALPIPASSMTVGNFDVTYTFNIENTGNATLSDLTLTDDWTTNFGGAFVAIVDADLSGNVVGSSTVAGTSNYGGSAAENLFDAGSFLAIGESVAISVTVEIDPDHATANLASGTLFNRGHVTATAASGFVFDLSDDPADGTNVDVNGDNSPDDPTSLRIGSMNVIKSASMPMPANSAIAGNYDVTYTFAIENTGNDVLSNLRLTDDWAANLGGAFVAIVDADLSDNVFGSPTVTGTNRYGGAAEENLFNPGSALAIGETVVITVTVEIDPDDTTANLASGSLLNSAIASATATSGVVINPSDDPTDGTDVDLNGDNDPDDATAVSISAMDITKVVADADIASSGTSGNFDVTYDFTVTNNGTATVTNLSLTDDFVSQFGGAFVQVVSVAVTNLSATNAPAANGSYDGTATSDLLLGGDTDEIRSGESFMVTLVVEIDPDNVAAIYNAADELQNSATVRGQNENGAFAFDTSDDPSETANVDLNSDNNPDDATTLRIGSLDVTAVASSPVPSTSGTFGNFEVTYTFAISNTGNEPLSDLTLTNDWATNLGGAFVTIVDADLSDDVAGSATVRGASAYFGAASENLFLAGSSLAVGETATVSVTVEVDPDSPLASVVSGMLLNRGRVSATSSLGAVVDLSDDPSDLTNRDVNGDNRPDDQTALSISAANVTKVVTSTASAGSGIPGNFDVTYTLAVANNGTETLSNLSLTDDLASQFGSAFVQVVSIDVTNIDATNAPAANEAYDGTLATDLLAGSLTDEVRPGETFFVTLVVEVDPDDAAAAYNSHDELQNTATVRGSGENGGIATDTSDDPSIGTNVDPNADNNPDDPTTLRIGGLEVIKSALTALPASQFVGSSALFGNYVVPYTITLLNVGNDVIHDLQLYEDLDAAFGGGFVGIIGTPAIRLTNLSGVSVVNAAATPFDGNANPVLFDASTSQLGIGDSVTVTIDVEIDPDSATANHTSESFENTAVGSGTDSDANFVTDNSDDPSVPGGNDDPTRFSVADIRITKEVVSVAPASSGRIGNVDVTYAHIVSNSGTETLSSLSLTEDLETYFGGAFVGIVDVIVANIDALTPPIANPLFDGTTGSDMLLGSASNALASGESFVVTLVVEVDPDNEAAIYNANNELVDLATASGIGSHSGHTSSDSDNPLDLTDLDSDNDGHPDDPTTLTVGDLYVVKTVTHVDPASAIVGATGSAGNFVVEYTIRVINTGNDLITNLQVVEDLAGHFGGALVGLIGTPLISVTNASGRAFVQSNVAAFDGVAATGLFDSAASQLDVGDSVTVVLSVEVDPDDPAANRANGAFANTAIASGTDSQGSYVTDDSDDPADLSSHDDPTLLGLPDIALTKSIVDVTASASGVEGNFDVTYALEVTNTGSEELSNLSLTDDLDGQYGGAFVRVVDVEVTNVNATRAPSVNLAYNGTAGSDMLLGSVTDVLAVGQSFIVSLQVEVDPDNGSATLNPMGELENSATASGMGNTAIVRSGSDDPADIVNEDSDGDGQPDDETLLSIGDLTVQMTAGLAIPANQIGGSTATFGNFVVPYTITLRNTGNVSVQDLSLANDLMSHFGSGFVGILGSPTVTLSNASGIAIVNPHASAFDGRSNTELLDVATSQLGIGDAVVVVVDVEVDPDLAILVSDRFLNSAIATGTDALGNLLQDVSDDPTDPTGNDDPTAVGIPSIAVSQNVVAATAAASGRTGNFDVTFALNVTNTGSETLTNVSLFEDYLTQLGEAFVGVVSIQVNNIDAASAPLANAAYSGSVGSSMLVDSGADALAAGQSFEVSLVVEIDPDNPDARFVSSGALETFATVQGDSASGTIASVSDDVFDATNEDSDGDGQPDDKTRFFLADLQVIKTAGVPVPSNQMIGASSAAGNYVIPFTVTVHNTGNDSIEELGLIEDLATRFGGGFIGVVGTPVVDLANNSGSSVANGNVSPFDGIMTTQLLDVATSRLGGGDSVTVTFNVEVDPDSVTAVLIDGGFQNSAVAAGIDSVGRVVSDVSDDPTNPNGDDDPTDVDIPSLAVTKDIVAAIPTANIGNYAITYSLTITNTGTQTLSNLSLSDDLVSQLGGAFVGVLDLRVENVDATVVPVVNTAFDGTASSDMILGAASELRVGESFVVTLVVEVDPDNPTSVLNSNGALENSAFATGEGSSDTVVRVSDAMSDRTDEDSDRDGYPDDATGLLVGGLEVIKVSGTPIPSSRFAGSTGRFGNFVIPYSITIHNPGNDVVDNLSLFEDIASQYGGAFLGLVGTPTINATNMSGATVVVANADGFDARSTTEFFDVSVSQIGPADSITLVFDVEVDPTAISANLVNGRLMNSAIVSGTDAIGPVIDFSDDPANLTGNDDPTGTGIPAIKVTAELSNATFASSGAAGNYDVTYTFQVTNVGTESLSHLSLTDDLESQFGGAFVRTVDVFVTDVNATSAPQANPGYAGNAGADMLIGSAADTLRPNETFHVTLVVEIDPDDEDANYDGNGELENSAVASGRGITQTVSSLSDNPFDLFEEDDDQDGQPDDETTFSVPAISLTKSLVNLDAANHGDVDNLELTYEFTLANVGNVPLTDLEITDDWLGNLGGAFVRIVDTDLSDNILSAAGTGVGGNADYAGSPTENILDGLGVLTVGGSVSIGVVIEVDPDHAASVLNAQGGLVNRAIGSGLGNGTTVRDLSDDPQNGTDRDIDGDNDPDDATALYLKNLSIQVDDAGITAVPGDLVTWTINYGNNGSTNATGVVVSELLPEGVTFSDAESSLGWIETSPGSALYQFSVGTLEAGDSGTIVFAAVVDSPAASGFAQLFNSVAIVDDGTNGPEATNFDNSDVDSTPVLAVPDYQITKDNGLARVSPGERVSYSVVAVNAGNQDGVGVVIVDTFPTDLLKNVIASHAGVVDAVNGVVTWDLGTLHGGESVTLVVEGDVVDSVGDGVVEITNQVTIFDDGTNGADPSPSNGSDSDTDIVVAAPDYEVTKSDGVNAVTGDDQLTYSITVRNVGNQDGRNLTITDTYPVSLLTVTNTSNGGVVDPVLGTVTWSVASLAVGEEIPLTLTGSVSSVFSSGVDLMTNEVVVVDDGSNGTEQFVSNNSDTDVNLVLATPDYQIDKSDGVSVVSAGDVIHYTVTVSNTGDQAGTGVVVRETYPNGLLSNISVSHGGVVDPTTGTITWDFASMSAGETIVLSMSGVLTNSIPAGTVSLTSVVEVADDLANGLDPTPNDNLDSDTNLIDGVAVPDYAIEKDDGVSSVMPGQVVSYGINVRNVGSRGGTGIVVVDQYDPQLLQNVTASAGGIVNETAGTVTWTLPTLAIGETAVVELVGEIADVIPMNTTLFSNQVSVSDDGTNGPDPNNTNNIDFDNNFIHSGVDFRIRIDDGASVVGVGDAVAYVIRVDNTGTTRGTGVVVTDQFSVGLLENVTVDAGGIVDMATGLITWNLGDVDAGETVFLNVAGDITSYVSAGIDDVSNVVSVSDDGRNGIDPSPEDNVAFDFNELIASPDFTIRVDDGVSTVRTGESTTYSIQVTHVGTQDATGVTVVDSFPKGVLTNVTASNGGVIDPVAGTVTWDLGTMSLGDMVDLTVNGEISSSLPASTISLINTVFVQDDGTNGPPTDPSDNTSTDIDGIEHATGPVYAITNDDGADSISPGESTTYTITLRNIGDEPGMNILLTNTLPPLLHSISVSDGGVLDPNLGTVTWDIANLADGGQQAFTITGVVANAPSGIEEIANTATATDFANAAVSETDRNVLVAAPAHTITNSDGVTAVRLGDSITYSIVVEHSGDQDATGVNVVNTYSTAVLTNVVASHGGLVDAADGTISWDLGSTSVGEVITLTVTADVSDMIPDTVTHMSTTVTVQNDGLNGPDPDSTDNSATDTNQVLHTIGPIYSIEKTDGQVAISPGETASYTISLRNTGDEAGLEILITDYLPAELGSVTASDGGVVDLDNRTVTWSVATLGENESIQRIVSGVVGYALGGSEEIVNTVTAIDSVGQNVEASDTSDFAAAPDLSIRVSDDGYVASEDRATVYELVASNIGTQDATGVVVTEVLPPGTQYVPSESSSGWVDVGDGHFQYAVGDLAVGEIRELRFAITIVDRSIAGAALTNTVQINDDGQGGADLNLLDNMAAVTTSAQLSLGWISKRSLLSTTSTGAYDGLVPIMPPQQSNAIETSAGTKELHTSESASTSEPIHDQFARRLVRVDSPHASGVRRSNSVGRLSDHAAD